MVRLNNVSTNPISLPLVDEATELFEGPVFDEASGGYVKKIQERTEIRAIDSVWIDGTHHDRLHQPNFIHVSDEKFEQIKAAPLYEKMLADGKLQVQTGVSQAEARKADAERDGE
jgi:hypothetical protein